MDPVWLLIALLFGFVAQLVRLPPLVGFLFAGFALNLLGKEGSALLELAAETGVLLLLFTIGLKIRLEEFLVASIWIGATSHLILSTLVLTSALVLLALAGLSYFVGLEASVAAALGFAFSFSSTVFAVKIFEERGETRAQHAVIAIGILIVQDIFAVAFLLLSQNKMPSIWALGLLALPLIRPLLLKIFERAGHGEVLILFGLSTMLFGAQLFDAVGMKGALGALVFGVLLSNHAKTTELAKSLLSLKDFFLLGFFLSIGLIGLPEPQDLLVVAGLLLLFLPVTMFFYFWVLTRLHIRARTAFLAMLGLATFSEFGLIVADAGMESGLLKPEWLVVAALAVAGSFVIGALLNMRAHDLYQRYEKFLCGFETGKCKDAIVQGDLGDAEVAVVGMGRVGRGAYTSMKNNYGESVVGIDVDGARAEELLKDGFNVIQGDAEDVEFWRELKCPNLKMVMLSLPTHEDMLTVARLLRESGFSGKIGAISRYDDEREALAEAGVDAAYNYYAEAGTGFADHIQREMGHAEPQSQTS